jgi:hypothetical protein
VRARPGGEAGCGAWLRLPDAVGVCQSPAADSTPGTVDNVLAVGWEARAGTGQTLCRMSHIVVPAAVSVPLMCLTRAGLAASPNPVSATAHPSWIKGLRACSLGATAIGLLVICTLVHRTPISPVLLGRGWRSYLTVRAL